jgi:ribosomal protein S18 acetylase RimI-like enzyme
LTWDFLSRYPVQVEVTNVTWKSNMNITIRAALKDDSKSVARLIAGLAGEFGEISPITPEYAARYLETPGSHVLLAEGDRQVVGLLSYSIRANLYHAGDTCLIEELIVQQSYRGRGIGGRLLEALFRRLVSLECVEVSVTTLPDNQEAIAFYKSHGMVDEAVYLEKHFSSL